MHDLCTRANATLQRLLPDSPHEFFFLNDALLLRRKDIMPADDTPPAIYVFQDWAIPAHMMGGLERYIKRGIAPGSFLTAVLENNFCNACKYADEKNLANLPAYAAYLYNVAPQACHGSPRKVSEWIEAKEKSRFEAKS